MVICLGFEIALVLLVQLYTLGKAGIAHHFRVLLLTKVIHALFRRFELSRAQCAIRRELCDVQTVLPCLLFHVGAEALTRFGLRWCLAVALTLELHIVLEGITSAAQLGLPLDRHR